MGSGLREHKQKKGLKRKCQKLAATKSVGGAGRLTDTFIDRIQNNYGKAI